MERNVNGLERNASEMQEMERNGNGTKWNGNGKK